MILIMGIFDTPRGLNLRPPLQLTNNKQEPPKTGGLIFRVFPTIINRGVETRPPLET